MIPDPALQGPLPAGFTPSLCTSANSPDPAPGTQTTAPPVKPGAGSGRGQTPTGCASLTVRFAGDVDRFAREPLSPFLNFHRPCLFATEQVDAKGKVRRTCRRQDVLTPLAKLKPLPGAARFLRQGVRFDDLDRAAAAQSDLHCPRESGGAQPRPRRDVPQGPRRRAGRGMTRPALSTAGLPALGAEASGDSPWNTLLRSDRRWPLPPDSATDSNASRDRLAATLPTPCVDTERTRSRCSSPPPAASIVCSLSHWTLLLPPTSSGLVAACTRLLHKQRPVIPLGRAGGRLRRSPSFPRKRE